MLKEKLEIIRHIAETLPDDDPDKVEMMNVEGDYEDLMEWALRKRNEVLSNAQSCKDLSDLYSKRKKSFESKADNMKEIIHTLMSSANERSYKGIAGTASISQKALVPIVQDESKLPERFKKIETKILKADINKAIKSGESIDGVVLDNGGEYVTIRS